VHCLAGENGSGKSTVIKVISGIHRADEGEVVLDGTPHRALTPRAAIAAGVQVIYQDFSLFPNLTGRREPRTRAGAARRATAWSARAARAPSPNARCRASATSRSTCRRRSGSCRSRAASSSPSRARWWPMRGCSSWTSRRRR
jgi:ABC-type branched-subunit amino acid transport system ATPase component